MDKMVLRILFLGLIGFIVQHEIEALITPAAGVTCKPVYCKMSCEYGWTKDSSGCEVCLCNEPCDKVSCPANGSMCVAIKEGDSFVGRCIALDAPKCEKPECLPESEKCEFGYERDFRGCDTCKCYDPCKSVTCKTDCTVIYEPETDTYVPKCIDSNGVECQVLNCTTKCEYGFRNNNDGCPVCKCNDPCDQMVCPLRSKCVVLKDTRGSFYGACQRDKNCSEISCRMACPYGYATGDDGCPLCACYNPCANVTCAEANSECSPIKIDELTYMGSCKSKLAPSCPSSLCADMQCNYGFVKDSMGCNLCKCLDPCENITCPGDLQCAPQRVGNTSVFVGKCDQLKSCLQVTCDLSCKYGRTRDDKGCELCACFYPCKDVRCNDPKTECVPSEIDALTFIGLCRERLLTECMEKKCNDTCSYGYMKDAYGCESCACANDPCLTKKCPSGMHCHQLRNSVGFSGECIQDCKVKICETKCKYGFAKDALGCFTCACAEPCRTTTCPPDQICRPKKAGDSYGFVGVCSENSTVTPIEDCVDEPCDLKCEYGFSRTDKGCVVCSCSNPCEATTCGALYKCEVRKISGDGENRYIGECSPDCVEEKCNLTCTFGLAWDFVGCPVCACSDPCGDVTCKNGYECSPQKVNSTDYIGKCFPAITSECMQKRCSPCEFGYLNDLYNCPTCNCSDPCKEVVCKITEVCKVLGTVAGGNLTGTCAPKTVCAHVSCANLCEFGYLKDKDGCNTCNCADDPCTKKSCDDGMKCVTEQQHGGSSEYLTKCITVKNPCMEVECRLECMGQGALNRYKLDCSSCHCDNPCLDFDCNGTMCFLTEKPVKQGNTSVTLSVGRCSDDVCPPLDCNRFCATGLRKDKFGCPSCHCRGPCEWASSCKSGQQCDLLTFNTENPHRGLTGLQALCFDCPKMDCPHSCIFGFANCANCTCADDPCSLATHHPTKQCQALFFPIYAQPEDYRSLNQNKYQDYIYLDSEARCGEAHSRYLDYFSIGDALTCDYSYNFKPIQCAGRDCWCVDARGGVLDKVVVESIDTIKCGFHSGLFISLNGDASVSNLAAEDYWKMRIDVSQKLSSELNVKEQQVIPLEILHAPNIAVTFKILAESENEIVALRKNIQQVAGKPLAMKVLDQDVNFQLTDIDYSTSSPISRSPSLPLTPFIGLPTEGSSTSYSVSPTVTPQTEGLSPISPSDTLPTQKSSPVSSVSQSVIPSTKESSSVSQAASSNKPEKDHFTSNPFWTTLDFVPSSPTKPTAISPATSESQPDTRFYLLTILLPILLVLFALLISVLVGLLVVKNMNRHPPSPTSSLFKQPIILSDTTKSDIYFVNGRAIGSDV